MSALDLSDVKDYLRVTDTDRDTELQAVIDAAEAAIGNLVGPLAPVSTTEVVSPLNDGTLLLSGYPVVSLTSATPRDGDALDVGDLGFDSGVVNYASGARFVIGTPVTVVFQRGWTTLPADLRLAVLELVRHLWQTQRGSGNARPRPDANVTNTAPGAAFTFPIRVEQLIAPHRVPRVA